jgi:flagellar hook-length control protein FliK
MSDFTIELNSFVSASGPAAAAAPIANILIERGFRDHLNKVQNLAPAQSQANRAQDASDSQPAVATGESLASTPTHDDDSASAPVSDDPDAAAQDNPHEVAGIGAEAVPSANANPSSGANTVSDADSGEISPESNTATSRGKAHLTSKPRPEQQKQQKPNRTLLNDVGEQSISSADSDADGKLAQDPSQRESIGNEVEGLGIPSNAEATNAIDPESSLDGAENVGRQSESAEAAKDVSDLTGQLHNDAAKAARRTRATQAKDESGNHAPTASDAISATAITSSPDAKLTAELASTELSPGNIVDNEHSPAAQSEISVATTHSQDDRTIAAPALLSSRDESSRQTTNQRDGLSDVDRVRLVQRVARAFHSVGDEGGEVQLRLRPPELGSLRMEIAVRDGVMTAQLETETAAARNILLDNLPQLRERLAEQNVKVERFDVNVRDDAQHRNDQTYDGQTNLPRPPRRGARAVERSARPASATHSISPRLSRGEGSDKLNVVI